MVQFFLGWYDDKSNYHDDIIKLFFKNILSPKGFWFDCITSIPWSYLDLKYYLVSQHEAQYFNSYSVFLLMRRINFVFVPFCSCRSCGCNQSSILSNITFSNCCYSNSCVCYIRIASQTVRGSLQLRAMQEQFA